MIGCMPVGARCVAALGGFLDSGERLSQSNTHWSWDDVLVEGAEKWAGGGVVVESGGGEGKNHVE